MDTAPLKSFATRARTDLIKEISARLSVVLAENSLARIESASAVRALELAIDRDGRDQVIDRIAYTWFNRIIALRFMDANGYNPSGVVSPESGRTTGQPEVLAEAKAGSFDQAVVPPKTQERITALLNGTRPSQDPQGEAYGLLLEAYCRHWHKSMPFMFEREGDYTELLIPTALLATDSVRDRAVKTLTQEVCSEVEVIGWLYQFYITERKDEVFAGFKKNKKAGAAEIPAATQLFTPHWIVRYLVENSLGRLWMLNNPSSRLAEQMDYYIRPVDDETDFLRISKPEELKIIDPAVGSGHMLTYAFDLLYAIYTEKGYDPAEIPSLILEHNLYGTEIDARAGVLASFALTMMAVEKRKLFLKNPVKPNVCVLEPISFSPDKLAYLVTKDGDRHAEEEFWNQFAEADTIGSLIKPEQALLARLARHLETLDDGGDIYKADAIEWASRVVEQAEYLVPRYAVVLANPPYMGAKNLSSTVAEFAKSSYPCSKSDLYSMFIERNLALGVSGGLVGMITMQSWMFLSTFAALRSVVLHQFSIATMAHLGTGAFDTIGGEVVATTAFVIRVEASMAAGVYLGLAALSGEAVQAKAASAIAAGADVALRYEVTSADFDEVPLASMAYWLSAAERHVYRDHPPLQSLADTKQGLATGDNSRFLRYWWEVSASHTNRNAADGLDAAASKSKWFPVQKGGPPRRWTGNDEYVVDWYNDGAEIRLFGTEGGGRPKSRAQNTTFYFREGATWSSLSGDFAVRFSPSGYVFETKGSMLFPSREEDLRWLLGYLNTPIARELIDSLSPTLDYHEGPVGRIPVIRPDDPGFVTERVANALADATALWTRLEVSPSFTGTATIGYGELTKVQQVLEADRLERLALEDSILATERDIEDHFRNSGGIDAAVFPLEGQRVTGLIDDDLRVAASAARVLVEDFASYAVGCMFGRYSLDQPGLILADKGATLQDFLAKVPNPTFPPDADNVIPIVDGDWFEDDIVARFRQFLRAAFGDERLEENLSFITESLGVKDIRDYFVKSFYADHVKRYKKRPIYWLFRSPNGSFSALIYLHRYSQSTVSTVLTGYLREFIGKLEANLEHQNRVAAGVGGASARDMASAQKEADRIRKVLVELRDYEHDVLFPLAGQQIALDLDDGVLLNYQKLGPALKDIGLKKGGEDE